MKRFYSKFGIYNKEKNSSNIFIMGNFDLVNLNARFIEISTNEKFNGDDVTFIEKEFNEIFKIGDLIYVKKINNKKTTSIKEVNCKL